MSDMGLTYTNAIIRNPTIPEREWRGRFLVDTGAIDSLVPGPWLESIGLAPRGTRVYELADGTEVSFDVAVAELEIMGETIGATVIFGGSNTEPLIGATALESAGIYVDPVGRELKRLPAVRL